MGLLDSVLGAALGGGAQGGGQPAGGGLQGALLQAVIGMLTQGGGASAGGGGLGGLGGALGSVLGAGQGGQGGLGGLGGLAGGLGGLAGLVAMLQRGGLGDAAQSWVSTGPNLPVSPDQLGQALPSDLVAGLAQQFGVGQGEVLGQLAQILPAVVDRATPQGQIPDDGGMGNLGDLGSLVGNLLGGQR